MQHVPCGLVPVGHVCSQYYQHKKRKRTSAVGTRYVFHLGNFFRCLKGRGRRCEIRHAGKVREADRITPLSPLSHKLA
jgi:hypothetical protein